MVSLSYAALAAMVLVFCEEEGVLRDPVGGVEGGEEQREDGHAREVQQLQPPLKPLRLKVQRASFDCMDSDDVYT